jgi:hypothetical protein
MFVDVLPFVHLDLKLFKGDDFETGNPFILLGEGILVNVGVDVYSKIGFYNNVFIPFFGDE